MGNATLADIARRAVPFLRDEAAKYEDDGSNEPLELVREIEAVLADQGAHASAPGISDITRQLIERDMRGRQKYGATLDRSDLSLADWLQHMAEELMDAAGYALAAKREAAQPLPHPDALPDGTLSKSTAKRVEALAAASVSERARAASLKEIVPAEKRNYLDDNGNPRSIEDEAYAHGWNACRAATLRALEHALTQQRGHGEAVDRDAWAEALELPQGYTVEEFLPGGWHYAWTRADGERMVSGATWNHPALAAIAAWQYAPATTPQPSADAVRDGYYLASFKRSHDRGYVIWWMPDNAGYTTDLEQAGIYAEPVLGYHDSDDTVPVPVALIDSLRVRRMIDVGDSANRSLWTAKELRKLIATWAKERSHA